MSKIVRIEKPAIYRFQFDNTDDMPLKKAASRWSWHKLSEVVEAFQYQASREWSDIDQAGLIRNFAPLFGLCDYRPIITTLHHMLHDQHGSRIRMCDVKKFFITPSENLGEWYIPAGCGNRILDSEKFGNRIWKLAVENSPGKHPGVLAYDHTGKYICDIPIRSIPVISRDELVEP